MRPFDGATNKTAVVVFCEGSPTTYPIPYVKWKWEGKRPAAAFDLSLAEVEASSSRSALEAVPISNGDATSPWLVTTRGLSPSLRKIQGPCEYHPHKGCDTSGANAIYWVERIGEGPAGLVLVRNLGDEARVHKFDSVEHAVEAEFVYPLLRGRDVQRWLGTPSAFILCPQQPGRFAHAYSEGDLKRIAPKLYSYFSIPAFAQRLRERAGYVKYLQPSGAPFYALYDIKGYTESHWKVVIREQSAHLTAAVTSVVGRKPIIPDHKLSLIATASEEEADYLTGVLNSTPARLLIREFGISTQISVSTIGYLRIPKFESLSALHRSIASCAKECRLAAGEANVLKTEKFEGELDHNVGSLWGLSASILARMDRALSEDDDDS
jgi:hypothetical protein